MREVFETNTFGVMAMCQAVIPQFRQHRAGTIVNVTSSATLAAFPLAVAYTASKTVECFRPMRPAERNHSGQRCLAEEALFPAYLFVHLDRVNDSCGTIRSTRGVREIVRFNAYPLAVEDQIINGIRGRLGRSVLAEPYLAPGERVRITEGAFSLLEGIFVANDGDQRVVLLLNILQKDQQLSFPLQSIRRIC